MSEKPGSVLVDEGDEEIARIREVRHRISEQFGHDPYRLVAYYMDLQKEHPEKMVPGPDSEVIVKEKGLPFEARESELSFVDAAAPSPSFRDAPVDPTDQHSPQRREPRKARKPG